MTREEARQFGLKSIEGHSDDEVFCCAPKTGKNAWTYGELREALIEDKCMEDSTNPIDDIIKLDNYLREKQKNGL